jgi:hypothetical protein
MKGRQQFDPDIVGAFEANVPVQPPNPFKPMGTYLNRHDADEAAQAMNRQMLGARWESCQDGTRFAIRRTR